MRMKHYTYRTIIEPDGKHFHGFAPALPGCHTFGKTIDQTKKYLRDAIDAYVQSLRDDKLPIPEDQSIESFETISVILGKAHA